ncbi:MAG: glycoside hydrolase family 38 C-terminal domain-containing protein [Candidatus Eremiobacteraeota bacterium]|nr:glycoside hydrolase family 38 C-terminal domain-containing protein [Candidatus Eremiobacteraeota bacterium]
MNILFVPHTHWDREWYRPLEVFRMNLSTMMLSLLEIMEHDPGYRTFVLDGQTVALEDFLEWFPHEKDRVVSMVKAGRIRLGPWYTEPDEFLVCGESLVRNLLMGKRIGEKYGDFMRIGYCPDTFGHVGQLPQILKGFNIDHAIFTRGMGDEPRSTEYWWESPDKSTVLATCLLHAYSIAGNLPEDMDSALERVRHEVERLAPYQAGRYALLNQGGDHYRPQPFLPGLVKKLNEEGPYEEVLIGDFEQYSTLLKAENLDHIPRIRGTLRGSRNYPLLCGVLSAHRDIKLRNEEMEILLLLRVEPLSALNRILGRPAGPIPLRQAWKQLLQNHAHDTICGCSVEAVTRETLLRFEKVEQIGNCLKAEALASFSKAFDIPSRDQEGASPWLIVNPLTERRTEAVEFTITEEAEAPVKRFRLQSSRGEEIPLQILETQEREGSHPHPSRAMLRDTQLLFVAENMPPVGASLVYLIKEDIGAKDMPEEAPPGETSPCISNDFFRISAEEGGAFSLLDLRNGKEYHNLGFIEDDADEGDTYNFSQVPGDWTLHHPVINIEWSVSKSGPLCQELLLQGDLPLSESLDADRKSRSLQRVACPLSMEIRLFRGVPRIDIRLAIDNRARDHRLRIAFPLGSKARSCRTDEAFDVIEIPEAPACQDWIERPCGTWPMGKFADLTGEDRGLAILARGIRELEIRREEGETVILLTLLRCVGWLSREGNTYRSPEAGPKYPTPSAQMEGIHRFEISLYPHSPEEKNTIIHYALTRQAPLEIVPVSPHSGICRPGESLLSVEPGELVFSALKESERGDGVILRVFNPTDALHTLSLKTLLPFRGLRLTNLAEEAISGELPVTAAIPVEPHRIITLELLPSL